MTGGTDLERLSAPALRAFFDLAGAWALTPAEQRRILGGVPESTFHRWQQGMDVVLTANQLERISLLLSIHRCLQGLLSVGANEWIRRPNANPLFGGRPALETMLAGDTRFLQQVRIFLEAQCGGWA